MMESIGHILATEAMSRESVRPATSLPVSLTKTQALQVAISKAEEDEEECYYSPAYPTLAEIAACNGHGAAIAFLVPVLFEIGESSGAQRKMDRRQLEQTAARIVRRFFYLKTSEILLFASRFAECRYGRFYGSVDPMVIMDGLIQFCAERNADLDHYDAMHREAVREINRKGAVSRERYEEMVRNNEPIPEWRPVTMQQWLDDKFGEDRQP